MRRTLCCILGLVFCLAAPAMAQDPGTVVPSWDVAGHGVDIRSVATEDGRAAMETTFPIGGGRSGFGRALSRLAHTVGVGGFTLTARTFAADDAAGDLVELRVYLRDLMESMPARDASLELSGSLLTAQRTGDLRVHGGDLREAEWVAHVPLADFVDALSESRLNGVFEGRQFVIERNQLAALRQLVLDVAPAGSVLARAPASSAAAPPVAATGGGLDADLLSRHGLVITDRPATDLRRDAVAWLVRQSEGEAGPFVLQWVLGMWETGEADWTPMAEVGDTLYLPGEEGVLRAVVTGRAAVEEETQGSLCRSDRFEAQGWLFDVAPLDGPLPVTSGWGLRTPVVAVPASEIRRFAGLEFVEGQPDYEVLQARAFRAIEGDWAAAMRAARGEGGRGFDDPRPTAELIQAWGVRVLRIQGTEGERLLAAVTLHDNTHYRHPPTSLLYLIGPDGKVLERARHWGLPGALLRAPGSSADVLVYGQELVGWPDGSFYFFEREPGEPGGCS
jgi:hypothetical protein